MAKKKQNIELKGFDDIDFNKAPDIESAESVIKDTSKVSSTAKAKKVVTPIKETPKKKGVFPTAGKKRTSFNIDEDLHKALKDYCYFQEVGMLEYVFEHLVRPDLAKKGYYPPKKRK